MAGFVPKDKMSRKARKELNSRRRVTWDFSPVTRTVENKKLYNRRRNARNRDDYGPGSFLFRVRGTVTCNHPHRIYGRDNRNPCLLP